MDTCTQNTRSHEQTDCLCCWLWPCPSVSLWPWVFLQLCDALSFCEYVFQNGVCVPVRVCQLVQMLTLWRVSKCFEKALTTWTHTVCMCCLSMLSEFSVVLCFFSTSILSVSVFQSVMKDKWTVDDRLMVWLMPHSSIFPEGKVLFSGGVTIILSLACHSPLSHSSSSSSVPLFRLPYPPGCFSLDGYRTYWTGAWLILYVWGGYQLFEF